LAIVTGGSRGIGAAISRKLASLGHPVAVNYTSNRGAAEGVVQSIEAAGGKALAVAGDVSREDDVRRLFETAEQAFGPVGVLVNSAGIIGGTSRVEDVTAEALQKTLAINVVGPFLCAKHAIRRMSKRNGGQGGSIVTISSVASRLGGPGEFVHYAASKGATDSFTLGLAREVAAEGIRVNAIAPGLIATDMNPQERLDRLVPSVPVKRAGTADEIAEAVAWLVSPGASYVMGAILPVSGGR
jgi:NAD(P)-dependent dehydrogenase (short-subunit alcohol dehydrogenase family)